ncbi:Hypothetical predicted protein [Octopus vulgaris]|uniref:Uncharacterized protein n=1 Tax=Octopus vulgaris TaxID=6645 RepID=A0AA36B2S5_OCTVU|nr:Hypothetical predicted protein [Octopus vulgaris]
MRAFVSTNMDPYQLDVQSQTNYVRSTDDQIRHSLAEIPQSASDNYSSATNALHFRQTTTHIPPVAECTTTHKKFADHGKFVFIHLKTWDDFSNFFFKDFPNFS